MAITPSSDLKLLKVPIEIDNKNQLTFSNLTAQYNYFNSLDKIEVTDLTYQRKDSIIRYGEHIDNLLEFNYCMYRNDNYSNKWFYCFITDMKYINDNMTEITIKTDVFQTWQFDLTYKQSFIEREHVNDDTIGIHTIPESLEHGEYISNSAILDFNYTDTTYVCVATSECYEQGTDRPNTFYNGIFSGLIYYVFKTTAECSAFINNLSDQGRAEIINSVFIIPQSLALDVTEYSFTRGQTNCRYYIINSSNTVTNFGVINLTRPTKIGKNYIPVNNKLFTAPYCYFNVTNNCGTTVSYFYEDFNSINNPTFNVYGAITPSCSIKAVPLNYKNVTENFEESINGAKLPICSWANDVYTNWLTQNAVNIGISIASSSFQIIGGAVASATGAGAGIGASAITSGSLGIASTLGEIYKHSLVAYQTEGNINSGDVVFSAGKSDLDVYYMSIKDEYARVIDKYFSMFGYKVNVVKLPNITGRTNWNYVKTIDCNIIADIPQVDLDEIKGIFNNGVTLWHNANTFLDYSQSNSIV